MQTKTIHGAVLARLTPEYGDLKALADLLGLPRHVVHNWRKRGIPRKYRKQVWDILIERFPSTSDVDKYMFFGMYPPDLTKQSTLIA